VVYDTKLPALTFQNPFQEKIAVDKYTPESKFSTPGSTINASAEHRIKMLLNKSESNTPTPKKRFQFNIEPRSNYITPTKEMTEPPEPVSNRRKREVDDSLEESILDFNQLKKVKKNGDDYII
jgi:hypothetical protein